MLQQEREVWSLDVIVGEKYLDVWNRKFIDNIHQFLAMLKNSSKSWLLVLLLPLILNSGPQRPQTSSMMVPWMDQLEVLKHQIRLRGLSSGSSLAEQAPASEQVLKHQALGQEVDNRSSDPRWT